MSEIEIFMLGIACLLGYTPSQSEIHQAKSELLNVSPEAVDYLIKVMDFVIQHLPEQKIIQTRKRLYTFLLSAINYRIAFGVHERSVNGHYLCPRCRVSLDRDFQAYCDRCGQHLKWKGYKKATVIQHGRSL